MPILVRTLALVSLSFFAWSPLAQAMDFAECLKMGLANSDRILAARAESSRAESDRDASVTNFLPQLSLTAQALWIKSHSTTPSMGINPQSLTAEQQRILAPLLGAMDFSSFTTQQTYNRDLTLRAYQPLTTLAQTTFDHRAADKARVLAKLNQDLTRDQVTLLLGSSYFLALLAEKQVSVFSRSLELTERMLTDAQNLAEQGVILKTDLLKIRIRHGEVETQLFQARSDLDLQKSYLAKLLNVAKERLALANVEVRLSPIGELSGFLERSQNGRREFKMLDLQNGIARDQRLAAYLALLPQIGAMAQAEWTDDGLTTTPSRIYSGGLLLTWNFWALGGDLLKARSLGYAEDKTVHEAKASRIDLLVAIEKAWNTARVAHQNVDVMTQTRQMAEESFRNEKARYEVGQTTTANLLDAQATLTTTEANYYTALYGAAMADAGLEAAVGDTPFAMLTKENPHD